MTWPIRIGVSSAGELLVGAAAVDRAELRGELEEGAAIWPSQLEHRAAVHYVRPLFDVGDPADRWRIVTPREAAELRAAGRVDLVRRFPRADRAKSIKVIRGALAYRVNERDHNGEQKQETAEAAAGSAAAGE